MLVAAVVLVMAVSIHGGGIPTGPVVAPAVAPVAHAVPAVAHAAVAPAVAYHHAIPYNVPPYSDRVDHFNKAIGVPVAAYAAAPVLHSAPFAAGVVPHAYALGHAAVPAVHAAPLALPHAHVAPYAAPYAHALTPYAAAPYAAAPYAAGPFAAAPFVAGPYAASPYAAAPYAHGLPAQAYAAAPILKR
ncbi:hypothetical protein CBL_11887 [Carabus blaptoides fortunei]